MFMLYGWFCVGIFFGVFVVSGVVGMGIVLIWYFLLVVVLFFYLFYVCYEVLFDDCFEYDFVCKFFVLLYGYLVVLGVIVFCGVIVEGLVVDWSGIYMKDYIGVSDGVMFLVYVVFVGMMFIMCMIGDCFKVCYDVCCVVWVGMFIVSFGIVLVVVVFGMMLVIFGFVIVGIGVVVVFLFVFSVVGWYGFSVLVVVVMLGYSGSLIGLLVFGFFVYGWGL